jgi:hypothetical protein
MLRKALCQLLCLGLALSPMGAAAQTPVSDPEVAKGIRQIDDGEYDSAILTLDAAARRLAASARSSPDLTQAYLYLGVAYLGKGHESSAKARFRDALSQAKDLSLSPEKFAPRVIEIFEKAKEEAGKGAPAASSAAPAPAPAEKGGSKKGLLLVGLGVAAAGGIGIAAASGGGGNEPPGGPGGGGGDAVFENESVVFGGGRDFVVDVRGSGVLRATTTWNQDGVVLGMYIVSLANPGMVLADGNQTATRTTSLQLPVTPGSYRISVTNSTGTGPRVTTTFTLRVFVP